MMKPLLTLDDQTEIVYSEVSSGHTVKVYIEKPDEKDCFHYATCHLPEYRWENVFGFDTRQLNDIQKIIQVYESQIYSSE